jgi:hypothetical protein
MLRDAADRLRPPARADRSFWGSRDAATVSAIESAARASIDTPWPHLLLSDYARYWRDGNRTAYEDAAGELRSRTANAVLMALLDDDIRWVDEAADGLQLLCEQSSWCWAAHEGFASARGEVVPDADEPYLDLGAGETVAVLAWADLALGDVLDERAPGLRRRLRRETLGRVIEPFLTRLDWHWLGLDGHLHNWNPWIHQNVLSAALLLVDDMDVRAEVANRCLEGVDRYRRSLPPDGSCDEGAGYFWNGPARLAEVALLLGRATGGALDLLTTSPMDELARFPMRMDLGNGWRVSFADCQPHPDVRAPWQLMYAWGRHSRLDDVVGHALAQRDPARPDVTTGQGLGRVLATLVDDVWSHAEPGPTCLPRTAWLPDAQVLTARQNDSTTAGLTLAAKGGHNDENHNHNDVGSYIVAVDSVPVLIDLGQQTYTSISFSSRRYEQLSVRAEWHNVPAIGGVTQRAGRQYAAQDVSFDESDGAPTLSMDLCAAYPSDAGCVSWRRRVRLDRIRGAVRVEDAYVLGRDASVELVQLLAGEIAEHRAGLLRVRSIGGRLVDLRWDQELGPGRLEPVPLDDEMLAAAWGPVIHRLGITVPAAREGVFALDVTSAQEGLAQ